MCEPIRLEELLELRDTSLRIREFAAILAEFEDKHIFAKVMKESLETCIKELNKIHHTLDRDIYIMKRKNKL